MKKNKHIGSNFDDFLKEEGILEEIEEVVPKKVFAFPMENEMKKKGKVFFHSIDGTGSLTISWSSLPKGDAIEAIKGSGVGFFSEKGVLLAVIFDEVQSERYDRKLWMRD